MVVSLLPILSSQTMSLGIPGTTTCFMSEPNPQAVLDSFDQAAIVPYTHALCDVLGVAATPVGASMTLFDGPVILAGTKDDDTIDFSVAAYESLKNRYAEVFSTKALAQLKKRLQRGSIQDKDSIQTLYASLNLYVKDRIKNAHARIPIEKIAIEFGLYVVDADKDLMIITQKEYDEQIIIKRPVVTESSLVAGYREHLMQDPFEVLLGRIRKAIYTGGIDQICEVLFYDNGELIEQDGWHNYWQHVFKKLLPNEIATLIQSIHNSNDVALFLNAIYQHTNLDTLFEVRLIRALSCLPKESEDTDLITLTSILEATLSNSLTMSVGICLLADSQLYAGAKESYEWARIYEELAKIKTGWKLNLYQVLMTGQLEEEGVVSVLGVRKNSVKKEYFLAVSAFKKADYMGVVEDSIKRLIDLAKRKDCPLEIKERIAGHFLEYYWDDSLDDFARAPAKEALKKFKGMFVGELDEAIDFAVGSTDNLRLGLIMWWHGFQKNAKALKLMIEAKLDYSSQALQEYIDRYSKDISEIDIQDLNLLTVHLQGCTVTFGQYKYIREQYAQLAKELQPLAVTGATAAEIASMDDYSEATFIKINFEHLSPQQTGIVLLDLLDKGGRYKYTASHDDGKFDLMPEHIDKLGTYKFNQVSSVLIGLLHDKNLRAGSLLKVFKYLLEHITVVSDVKNAFLKREFSSDDLDMIIGEKEPNWNWLIEELYKKPGQTDEMKQLLLQKMGDSCYFGFVDILHAASNKHPEIVVNGLMKIGTQDAYNKILSYLNNGSKALKEAACNALENITNINLFYYVFELAKTHSLGSVRIAALKSLYNILKDRVIVTEYEADGSVRVVEKYFKVILEFILSINYDDEYIFSKFDETKKEMYTQLVVKLLILVLNKLIQESPNKENSKTWLPDQKLLLLLSFEPELLEEEHAYLRQSLIKFLAREPKTKRIKIACARVLKKLRFHQCVVPIQQAILAENTDDNQIPILLFFAKDIYDHVEKSYLFRKEIVNHFLSHFKQHREIVLYVRELMKEHDLADYVREWLQANNADRLLWHAEQR